MIEEIAHLLFGPAGAVAAIVMLDSMGGNDKKSNDVERRSKALTVAPRTVSATEEQADAELDDDSAEEAAAKTLKKRKSTEAKEKHGASNGRAPKRIVSADKKGKSKTTKQATVPARRSKTRANRKSRKAA